MSYDIFKEQPKPINSLVFSCVDSQAQILYEWNGNTKYTCVQLNGGSSIWTCFNLFRIKKKNIFNQYQ